MVHRMCYNHYIIDERKVHNMKLSVQNWEIVPDSDGMGMLNVFSEEGDAEFPLLIRTFDIPEDAAPENAELDIDVILYPESLRIFRDEEEYRQKSGSHRAAESVIPSGCFPPRPDPNFVKSNTDINLDRFSCSSLRHLVPPCYACPPSEAIYNRLSDEEDEGLLGCV